MLILLSLLGGGITAGVLYNRKQTQTNTAKEKENKIDIGVLPDCPSGYDMATDKVLCYKICPDNWKGDKSETQCRYDFTDSTIGSGTMTKEPAGCNDGDTIFDNACYKLPDKQWKVSSPGIIEKNCPDGTSEDDSLCVYNRGSAITQKPECPTGKVKKGDSCYDPPPSGWEWTAQDKTTIKNVCPSGTNDSGITCWYDRGVGTVPRLACPEGKIQKGAECYEKPPTGYDWTTPGGLLIGKICPDGSNDSGTTCWYDRGVGLIPKLACPEGQIQKGVECYAPPPAGYNWTTPGGILVGKVCPSGSNDSGTTCWYDRGVGLVPKLACPSGQIQKGVECYAPPPAGYNWTTPGGLLIGKICPSGSNDSGTTCWYDRGAGRIPDKKPCPTGMRDDGTSCWKDTYGRGVGRTPDKLPCNSWGYSWRDDGTSCWSDAHIYGKGCCCTIFGCCHNCPAGYTDDGCTCRKTDVGIKKTLFDRQTCRADEDKYGSLCYPKCKTGYHAVGCCLCEPDGGPGIKVTLGQRQYCQADEEMIGGLCYKKPRAGFNCTLTHCMFGKDVKSGTKLGNASPVPCDSDRQKESGLCYKKPRDGFTCTATHCMFGKDVKSGQKLGLINPNPCDSDRQKEDGLCYRKPRDGFKCTATHCMFGKDVKSGTKVGLTHQECDSDRNLEVGLCYRKPKDGFSCTLTHCKIDKTTKEGTKFGAVNKSPCDSGMQLEDELCYNIPKPGFSCNASSCQMTKEMKTIDGTVPNKCKDGFELIDNQCYATCPSGFERMKDATKCTMKCPDGYIRKTGSETQCVPKCPEGYNTGSEGCERPHVSLETDGICQNGYTKKNGRCYKNDI